MPQSVFITFCLICHFVSVSIACMAMVPTHPSTTRPPQVSTTALPPTTTSTTSTTTTSTDPPCLQCEDLVYEAPDAAVCGGVLFDCTDAAHLMPATTPSACKRFACGDGAKMFAYPTSGEDAEVAELACSQQSPPKYEDSSSPAKTFPDKARVFCKKEYMCDCADVTYSMADPEAKPATTLAPTLPSVVGKFGCETKDCGQFQLQSADHSTILHSITCNPKLPGFADKSGAPVTQPVACYDWKCTSRGSDTFLCPSGHFCEFIFNIVSNCGSICAPGDLFVAYNGGKSVKDGVSVPMAEVFCDGDVWQPFGIQSPIELAACARPVGLMMPTPPADAMCPALTVLAGGSFSDLVYTPGIKNGVPTFFATCRNGMVTVLDPATNNELLTPYLFCMNSGWQSLPSNDPITQATCKPNSCVAMLIQAGFTPDEISSLRVDDESSGHCRVSCTNGEPIKISFDPTENYVVQDASLVFSALVGVDDMIKDSVTFESQDLTC